MTIAYIVTGAAMTLAAPFLLNWGVPKEGEPSRLPDKWGLPLIFPYIVACLLLGGIVVAALGIDN